jgi:hypothetical protein
VCIFHLLISATYSAHRNLLVLIALAVGKERKLWNSLQPCNILNLPSPATVSQTLNSSSVILIEISSHGSLTICWRRWTYNESAKTKTASARASQESGHNPQNLSCLPYHTWVNMEQRRNDTDKGKPENSEKTVLMPLCPPQIPRELTWARTQDLAVWSWPLAAWAVARPDFVSTIV